MALFNTHGTLLSRSTQEYTLLTPTTLAVELGVETYWNAFKKGVAQVLEAPNEGSSNIKALGISAQGETLIVVDKESLPLRNAIVWLDNRAQ